MNQVTELVELFNDDLYSFPDKKAVYKLTGLTKEFDGFYVWFNDCAIGIDSFSKSVDELDSNVINDLLKRINKVL